MAEGVALKEGPKNSCGLAYAAGEPRAKRTRVFWFFSSRKHYFLAP
jgi:hypothetical protein